MKNIIKKDVSVKPQGKNKLVYHEVIRKNGQIIATNRTIVTFK